MPGFIRISGWFARVMLILFLILMPIFSGEWIAKGYSADGLPVSLTIIPKKQIYTNREGVQVHILLKALAPVTLCLEKDIFTQFQFTVYRSGKGRLNLQPIVEKDNRVLFQQDMQTIALKQGESFSYWVNLKRLKFSDGEQWEPGDYAVSAIFHLCNQTQPNQIENPANNKKDSAAQETAIPSQGSIHFMIMD